MSPLSFPVILVITCEANRARRVRLQRAWLDAVGLPYVWATGGPDVAPGSHAYDPSSRELSVGCDDDYDSLPHKVAYAARALLELFPDAPVVLKVDDDVVADPAAVRALLAGPWTPDAYAGRVAVAQGVSAWGIDKYRKPQNRRAVLVDPPIVYCGGPAYLLGRRALQAVARGMDPDALKFEDANVGRTLAAAGIAPRAAHIYTDDRAEFEAGSYPAWHDSLHVSEALFG